MKKKIFSLLVLLMVAVTGAWADGVSIKFEANGHEKVVDNVTLPYTFRCNYQTENGELDRIIKELYGLTTGYCYILTPTSDNSNVTAFLDGQHQCITIESAFEGTAKVTGVYYDYDNDINYELTISVLSSGPAEPVASWVGNSAINANGTWYYAGSNFGWCTGGAFNGADLGTITTLSLGGQSQAWAEGNANWNDGNLTMTMGYKIDGGADESLSLNWFEFADNNNKFQSGGSSWAAQDIDISGLTPGNHTIAVWFTRDDKWDSNNSANYVANFTIPTPAATTYTVSVKEGTEDADKWTADPNPAEAGQTVTVTYSGLKKVKSVKAVKKASAEPAGPTTVTWDFSVLSGTAGTGYENGGVKLEACDGEISFDYNQLNAWGNGITITNTLGKNFTSIVIYGEPYSIGINGGGWSNAEDNSSATWTGNSESVYIEEASTASGITSIVFTLVDE